MADKELLNSLKIGDKVAVRELVPGAGYQYTIHIIENVTPTGQIRVSGINQRFRDGMIPSDRYSNPKYLCPLTDEIEEKVIRRDTLEMMRTVSGDKISTAKLRRIKAILEEVENSSENTHNCKS